VILPQGSGVTHTPEGQLVAAGHDAPIAIHAHPLPVSARQSSAVACWEHESLTTDATICALPPLFPQPAASAIEAPKTQAKTE
jgi:hypothetical protein